MPRAGRPQEMTAPGLAGPVKEALIESILPAWPADRDFSRPLVPDLPAAGRRGSTTTRSSVNSAEPLSSPNALASKSMTDVISQIITIGRRVPVPLTGA